MNVRDHKPRDARRRRAGKRLNTITDDQDNIAP
jgi:hypothetical protein